MTVAATAPGGRRPKKNLPLSLQGDPEDGGLFAAQTAASDAYDAHSIEVLEGLAEGDLVVVVGQDGLSDGTPVQVLNGAGAAGRSETRQSGSPAAAPDDPPPGQSAEAERRGPGQHMDPSQMTPEQLERAKELMRERGLSEDESKARLDRRRQGQSQ